MSCTVLQIDNKATFKWTSGNTDELTNDDTYAVDKGDISNSKQTSILTVKPAGNTEDRTFTCEVTPVDGTPHKQVISVETFGKYTVIK